MTPLLLCARVRVTVRDLIALSLAYSQSVPSLPLDPTSLMSVCIAWTPMVRSRSQIVFTLNPPGARVNSVPHAQNVHFLTGMGDVWVCGYVSAHSDSLHGGVSTMSSSESSCAQGSSCASHGKSARITICTACHCSLCILQRVFPQSTPAADMNPAAHNSRVSCTATPRDRTTTHRQALQNA